MSSSSSSGGGFRDYKGIWAREQIELKESLIARDELDFLVPPLIPLHHPKESHDESSGSSSSSSLVFAGSTALKYVGGVDISFVKDNVEDACASLVVLEFPSLEVIYERYEMVKLALPYISGYLAFREAPHLVKLIDELKATRPDIIPQVILVDGNGILHYRGFGLASHLGVLVNIPTIGCAKNLLYVDGLNERDVKRLVKEKLHSGGEAVELIGKSGTLHGAALRSHDGTTNAIYVSIGHRISLPSSLAVVHACTRFRIPEPVRQADLRSRAYLRDNGYQGTD